MIQMRSGSTMNGHEKILGVEGGGTKTAWVLVERDGADMRVVEQGKLPPSNFRLATPERLGAIFSELPKEIDRAGIFLAGCGTEEDRRALSRLCAEIWPNAKIITGSDRDSGLAAALGQHDGIVVNAGSGSSVTGRRGDTSKKRVVGDISSATPAEVTSFPFKPCASFCANTTCTAGKRNLPRVFCALWR